jgi:hypothetical protein
VQLLAQLEEGGLPKQLVQQPVLDTFVPVLVWIRGVLATMVVVGELCKMEPVSPPMELNLWMVIAAKAVQIFKELLVVQTE